MKEKRIVFVVLILLLALMPLILAEDSNATSLSMEQKARNCIADKITNKTCSQLTFDEKVFAVLSTGRCVTELKSASLNDTCWPKDNCDIISTSKAVYALGETGSSTKKAEEWLLSKNKTATNLKWFLQVESNYETTNCKITYDDNSYNFVLNEDKTISLNSGGRCLSLSDNLWLQIEPACYGKEFTLSCDSSFLTSTFFVNTAHPEVVYIPNEVLEGAADAELTESVNSYCFSDTNSCSYKSSLWVAFVLNRADKDVSSFLPYLVSSMDEATGIFPEEFLYFLTGDYKEEVLAQRSPDGSWKVSKDEFFDTACALSIFSPTDEKMNKTMKWLASKQNEEGCWGNGILDTGVILTFVWPKFMTINEQGEAISEESCTDKNFFCMPRVECSPSTNILNNYKCITGVCCSKNSVATETCEDAGGSLCDSNTEQCRAGEEIFDYNDYSSESVCCIGSCNVKKDISTGDSDCELNGGTCSDTACSDSEEDISADFACNNEYQSCCKEKSSSLWWIFLLVILIIFAVLGIIFRDKIQPYWNKMMSFFNSKFKKGSPSVKTSVRAPMNVPMQRTNPRTILPPASQRRPTGPIASKSKSSSEIDEVLKKLREMGK